MTHTTRHHRMTRTSLALALALSLSLSLGACSAEDDAEASGIDDTIDAESIAEDDADEAGDAMLAGGGSTAREQEAPAAMADGLATTTTELSAGGATSASRGSAADLDPGIRFDPSPVDTEQPEVPGISPFVDAGEDALSTFALDVDTASWTQAMAALERGQRPDPDRVRPEEFVNWFDYGYERPDEGWAIAADGLTTSPWDEDRALLRVGLTTAALDSADRPDAVLTFVVDTSGSMSGQPLQTVKETLTLLVEQLRPTDRIGIVEYGSRARVLLEPAPLSEAATVLATIDELDTNGSTNAAEGLQLGYEMAMEHLTDGGIDVVVLASDGVANVGLTDAGSILKTIDDGVGSGINLLALGVSDGGYNDDLMEQLSNRGNGTTYYLRDRQDAERLFLDELEETLVVAAKDTKVQLDFNADVVEEYRLIGYDNRAVADEDFRNDAVDAGEVGAGHEVTAMYELVLRDGASGRDVIGTVQLRWEDPESGEVSELERAVRVRDLTADGGSGFGTAVQAVALAEVLRDSRHLRWDLDDLTTLDDLPGSSREVEDAIALARDAR